jgi:hypothetical protein
MDALRASTAFLPVQIIIAAMIAPIKPMNAMQPWCCRSGLN